jgi:hypothetical protein
LLGRFVHALYAHCREHAGSRFNTILVVRHLLGSRRYRGMDTVGKMHECFNNEAFCKKRAAAATDATASAVFSECARCWHELADCWRELTAKTAQGSIAPGQ